MIALSYNKLEPPVDHLIQMVLGNHQALVSLKSFINRDAFEACAPNWPLNLSGLALKYMRIEKLMRLQQPYCEPLTPEQIVKFMFNALSLPNRH